MTNLVAPIYLGVEGATSSDGDGVESASTRFVSSHHRWSCASVASPKDCPNDAM
jgi:hypothetical protein